MLISTKGRYALRVMIDLAEQPGDSFIPLKTIADRQHISEKYLESIMKLLVNEDLLLALRGKGGGYRLAKAPEDYTVGEILRVTEETLAPVSCLEADAKVCPNASRCRTVSFWRGLDQVIHDYLDSKTLNDLIQTEEIGFNYVI